MVAPPARSQPTSSGRPGAQRAEALLRRLRAVRAAESDPQSALDLRTLGRDLQGANEAACDYRVRLAEHGVTLPHLRGLGPTESHMARSANRLKKRGRSWGVAQDAHHLERQGRDAGRN